jgi:hypothetical protein
MQLILSELDLEKMPRELRQNLVLYLAGAKGAEESAEPDTTALGRSQVTAVLREASFHRDGHALHVLLKVLAYREETEAPKREKLVEALPGEARANLGRHLSTINRLASRAAKQPGAKLWHYRRTSKSYAVHPITRRVLQDLVPTLERSGQSEEPLWEGSGAIPEAEGAARRANALDEQSILSGR